MKKNHENNDNIDTDIVPQSDSQAQFSPSETAPEQSRQSSSDWPLPDGSSEQFNAPENNDITEWAHFYYQLGLNVIPTGNDKLPAFVSPGTRLSWTLWQRTRQTENYLKHPSWRKAPGLAAVCGEVSGGLVCLDIDKQSDRQPVEKFLQELDLPRDYPWVVVTPGGGWHVWLRTRGLDLGTKGKLSRKGILAGGEIELRFERHLTALPPSQHPDGGRYAFDNEEAPSTTFATVNPSALLAAYDSITEAKQQPSPPAPRPLPFNSGNGSKRYAQAALEQEVAELSAAREGSRNDQLNASAFSLGQLVGAGLLDKNEVEAALTNTALAIGLDESETRATLRSGLEAGIAEPRSVPDRPTPPHRDSDMETVAYETFAPSAPMAPKNNKDLTHNLANAILSDTHFARDAGGKLYYFDDSVYKPKGEDQIELRVKELLNLWGMTSSWSSHRARETVRYIKVDAPELWERPPLDIINVRNGLLDVKSRELMPHDPSHLSTVQLPVTYDPAAVPAYWDEFCRETFPQDAYEAGVHWQIVAWLMTPDTSLQKALLLLGDGGNGKSRSLAGLTGFLGSTNVTRMSLQKLEQDRFAVARLQGKMANICPDLPSQHLQDSAMFKQLTGDDGPVTGEHKFHDSFEFTAFARLVFSANHLPVSSDHSEGFFRRWIVLPFMRTFTGQVASRDIDKRLTAPRELSGVLNKALDYLPQVRESGITCTPSMEQALNAFRRVTDPLAVWLDSETESDPDEMVGKAELLDAYNAAADANGWKHYTAKAFRSALKRLRPKLETKQRTYKGKPKVRVYMGIRLRKSKA